MKLIERNRLQLDDQQQALLKEFDYWHNNSNSGTAYAKHQSQIQSITGTITQFLQGLQGRIPADEEPFEQSSFRLNGILYANHMWAFFRSKFALRQINSYDYSLKRILDCADEFAWNCYEPALAQARQAGVLQPDELKEPPLTFFTSDAGPFMAQRHALFSPEGIAGHSEDFKRFQAALEQLPVPIIGVPWSQSEHLPTAVVIAHEVGHLVERDFSAAPAFTNAIRTVAGINDSRRSYWCAWASELFADTYAILCTGPAYVAALMDYLVAPRRIVEYETLAQESAERYPTRSLRMVFNLAVLNLLILPDEEIGKVWHDAYPCSALPEYDKYCQEAPRVAEVFLKTPVAKWGGVPVTQVTNMTTKDWEEIEQQAQHLLEKSSKWQEPSIDRLGLDPADQIRFQRRFRTWFTAAMWAYYTSPDAFVKFNTQHLLLTRLAKTIDGTTRAPSEMKKPAATPAAIERAGQTLLAHFMESARSADPPNLGQAQSG